MNRTIRTSLVLLLLPVLPLALADEPLSEPNPGRFSLGPARSEFFRPIDDTELRLGYRRGNLLVRFSPSVRPTSFRIEQERLGSTLPSLNELLGRYEVIAIRQVAPNLLSDVYQIAFGRQFDVDEVAAALAALPEVVYAERNALVTGSATPNDFLVRGDSSNNAMASPALMPLMNVRVRENSIKRATSGMPHRRATSRRRHEIGVANTSATMVAIGM